MVEARRTGFLLRLYTFDGREIFIIKPHQEFLLFFAC
jgi:hypothetical protein